MYIYNHVYLNRNTDKGVKPFTDLFVTMRNGRIRYSRFFSHLDYNTIKGLAEATYQRMKKGE